MVKRMQRVFGDIDALRYVDGLLEDDRRAAFAAHLAEEPAESDRIDMWARQNDMLRATFGPIALEPTPIWLRLGNMVPDRPSVAGSESQLAPILGGGSTPRIGKLPAPAPHRGKALLASAVLLTAIGVLMVVATRNLLPLSQLISDPRPPTADTLSQTFVGRAIDAYRTFATDPVHPVEVPSTQQTQLEHWLQRRISVPIHAPDLRTTGWSLLGGRLAPGDLGPGAFLVYENEAGERLGLYIARSLAPPRPGMSYETMPGGSAVHWVSGPVGVVVTVDKDMAWLTRNADSLRASIDLATTD